MPKFFCYMFGNSKVCLNHDQIVAIEVSPDSPANVSMTNGAKYEVPIDLRAELYADLGLPKHPHGYDEAQHK